MLFRSGAKSRLVPKDCTKLLFEECTCGDWHTKWKDFTRLVSLAIHDLGTFLPRSQELVRLLKPDPSSLSEEAKRLLQFVKEDLNADGGRLHTNLSSTFLVANVPELQVALNNLMDTEQGSELRAWTRVFSAIVSVEKVGGPGNQSDKLICQVLSHKDLKAIVVDVLRPFIMSKKPVGFGWLWRPPFDTDGGEEGLERSHAGWTTLGEDVEVANILPPKEDIDMCELGGLIAKGEIKFAPCPFLRGAKKIPTSFEELCALSCLVSTVVAHLKQHLEGL